MRRQKNFFYITIFVLALFLSACSNDTDVITEDKSDDLSSHYIEEKISVPDGITNISDVTSLNTGELRIAGMNNEGQNGAVWDSGDNGETWTKVLDYAAILSLTVTDNNVAYLSPQGEIAVTVNKATHVHSEDEDEDEHDHAGDVDHDMYYYLLSSDGNFRELTKVPNEIRAIRFTKDGALLGIGVANYDFQQQIYALDTDTGEIIKSYYSADEGVSAFTTSKNHIYMLSNDGQATTVDLKTGEKIENEKELENINQKVNAGTINSPPRIDISVNEKGEQAFYLGDRNGIHYYNGNKVERLVDAERSFLGIWWINTLFVSNKNDLFVVADNGEAVQSLLRYSYSDTVVANITEELTVYTLIENESLKKEVVLFQQQYPEIKLNLEVGVPGGVFVENGTATTDAIKTLNTEILAGNGPDIIFFDGIAVDNYIDQGLLVDLTATVKPVAESQGILENIAKTYERENKLFALPTRFATMMVMGDGVTAASGKELELLVAQMQALHESNPNVDVFESWALKQMASIFYRTHLTAKIADDGTLARKDIENFYSLLKEVDELRSKKKDSEGDPSKVTVNKNYIKDQTLSFISHVYDEKVQLAIDYISSASAYRDVIIAKNKKGFSNNLVEFNAGKFYVPQMTVGINAKSEKIATAQSFVAFSLMKDIQLENQYYGFPINKQALQECLQNPINIGDEFSGNLEEQEQIEAFELLMSLDTPANTDSILMGLIMDEAENHLRGKKDLNKATDDALKKVKLYLAE